MTLENVPSTDDTLARCCLVQAPAGCTDMTVARRSDVRQQQRRGRRGERAAFSGVHQPAEVVRGGRPARARQRRVAGHGHPYAHRAPVVQRDPQRRTTPPGPRVHSPLVHTRPAPQCGADTRGDGRRGIVLRCLTPRPPWPDPTVSPPCRSSTRAQLGRRRQRAGCSPSQHRHQRHRSAAALYRYRGRPVPDMPCEDEAGIILNDAGRIDDVFAWRPHRRTRAGPGPGDRPAPGDVGRCRASRCGDDGRGVRPGARSAGQGTLLRSARQLGEERVGRGSQLQVVQSVAAGDVEAQACAVPALR